MNILLIVSSDKWDGKSSAALNLSRALVAGGHKCVAVTRRNWNGIDLFRRSGVEVHRMLTGGLFDLIAAPAFVSRVLRSGAPWVVQVFSAYDCSVAAKAIRLSGNPDVRLVATLHEVPSRIAPATAADLDLCSALVVESETARGRLSETGYSIGDRLHVIASASEISPTPLPCTLSPDAPVTFIYVGQMTKSRGIDLLVDAFMTLRDLDVRLIMCGEGPGREVMPVIRRVRDSGLESRVEWTGQTDRVAEVIARADVGVFPWREHRDYSLALVECQSTGRPIISSNRVTPELATFGPVIDPDKPGDLAAAMRYYAAGDRAAFSHDCVSVCWNYGNFCNKYYELYKMISS